MKKILYVGMVILLVAALFLVPGCATEGGASEGEGDVNGDDVSNGNETGDESGDESADEGAAESAWEITVLGAAGDETVVTIEAIKEMEAVELEAEAKGEVSSFKGVVLNMVLAEAGFSEAVEVTLTAVDGYSAAISGEVALSENTILAYECNGADLSGDEKNGPVRLVTTDESPQVWVGQLSTIEVK